MRSDPTSPGVRMKTALFAGWKARFYSMCMLMLFSALVVVGMASANAQSTPQVTPLPTEPVTTEPLPSAQPAASPAAAAEAAPVVEKGDVAWMLTSTLLVLLMVVPGLALFYG
ncbi:ammonium transporter, partial [Xanthomonas vasicola]